MQSYLSFRVGFQWYGISVDNVIEVLHLMALTELPVSADDILGLMTVRDVVIPVLDLRLRFKLTDPIYSLNTPIITARLPPGVVGLVVDEIDNVEPVAENQIVNYDDTTLAAHSAYVAGVARLPERLILLLNTASLGANAAAYVST
jgi:purine-binding chemotaxis protein CheW